MTFPSLELHREIPLTNKWIDKCFGESLWVHAQTTAPQHCEHAGKLSNHQDPNQKRWLQKRLLTTIPVSTIRNQVCHSDCFKWNIVPNHIT